MPRKLLFEPPRLLSEDQLGRIHEAAVRILLSQGLRVRSPEARQAAARAGLRVEGERVFPDAATIEQLVSGTRAEGQGRARPEPGEEEPHLVITVPNYQEFVHDPETDDVVPYTAERLIEATKFVDAMSDWGVIGAAPGIAPEIPADLQQLHQYWVGARFSRHGSRPVDARSPRALPYAMDMAEALGHPYRYHAVYVVSPLSLGGASFECLRAVEGRLAGVHVSNMSSVGGTAPVHLPAALALGAAEVMGAAIVVAAVSPLPVGWSIRVCPFDPRTMAMTLGSPEDLLFQRASDELNAWYHGQEPGPPAGLLHTQAKVPDAQAAGERMCQFTFGALFGARHFGGGGTLSLDEVFSPEQLVIDCELRDYVQHFIRGPELDSDVEAWVAEASEGLEHGFLALERAAAEYRRIYWLPRLFERRAFGAWQQSGKPRLRERAKEMVRERLRQHSYQLDREAARELDRIYARAQQDLASA